MVTRDDHADVIGFNEDGSYIEIRAPDDLPRVLNNYYKQRHTSSFIRQLNNYGFRRLRESLNSRLPGSNGPN